MIAGVCECSSIVVFGECFGGEMFVVCSLVGFGKVTFVNYCSAKSRMIESTNGKETLGNVSGYV